MNQRIFLYLIIFIILLNSVMSSPPSINDTVAYWDLTNLGDSTPNGNDLTNSGATSGATGIIGDAYSFDGSSSELIADTGYSDAPISVSVWFNADSFSGTRFIWGQGNSRFWIAHEFKGADGLECGLFDGSNRRITTGEDSTGVWHHMVATVDAGGTLTCYLNGVSQGSVSTSGINQAVIQQSIGSTSAGANNFDGVIDEVLLYSGVLSSQQVEYLYNGGSPESSQQYPYPQGNITINVRDFWNNQPVNNVSGMIDGVTYTNSTGNIIYTDIPVNLSREETIYLSGENYFSRTFPNETMVSRTLRLYQSDIDFITRELYTNNILSNVTYTIDSTTAQRFFLSAGNYNVTATKNNYFPLIANFSVEPLDNKTVTLDGMFNAILNITAINGFSGNQINTFNITILSDVGTFFGSTTNGWVSFGLLQDYNYTIIFQKDQYITNNRTVYLNQNYTDIQLSTFAEVDFQLNFFDEETLNPINNVSFIIFGEEFSGNFTTGTSSNSFFLSQIPEGTYEIRYEKPDYRLRSYYIKIPLSSVSLANISLYGIEEDISQLFIRRITDQGNNPLTNFYVQVQRPYPTNNQSLVYRTVEIALIDNQGDAVFSAIPNTQQYRLRILNQQLVVINVLSPSYLLDATTNIVAKIGLDPMQSFNVATDTSSSLIYQNSTNSFVLDYSAPTGTFQVCLEVVEQRYRIINTQTQCLNDHSGTIAISINASSPNSYIANAYLYPTSSVKILINSLSHNPLSPSTSVLRYVGPLIFFVVTLIMATITGFTNPTPAIILSVGSSVALGLQFVGLFSFATILGGGLMIIAIIVLLLIRESIV